jgi:glyoxylate reductase
MKNKKPLVLMTHDLPEDWVGELLEDYQVITGFNEERGLDSKLIKHLDKAEGILCLLDDPIPAELLERSPNLKVVSSMAVGVDNINCGAPAGSLPPASHRQ